MITKNLKKNVKKNGLKTAVTASSALTVLLTTSASAVNAAVDFSGGVTQVANEVTSQGKTIAGTVFAVIAGVALIFTAAKGIKAAFDYRRGETVHIGPVIAGGIGTIVAGLASSTMFFSWFGL